MSAPANRALQKYILGAVLGSTDSSTTYQTSPAGTLAIKVWKEEPGRICDAELEIEINSLLREGLQANTIDPQKIKNLNIMLEAYTLEGRRHGVFPLIEGVTLEKAGYALTKLDPAHRLLVVLRAFTDVCRGLELMHKPWYTSRKTGIVHRDVKPGNVMLTPLGTAVLFDYGLSKPDDKLPIPDEICGSFLYSPEEQLMNKHVRTTADMYSLGMSVYETLTGDFPHNFELTEFDNALTTAWKVLEKIQKEAPEKLSKHFTEAPKEITDLVSKLLAKDPTTRPTSAQTAECFRECAMKTQRDKRVSDEQLLRITRDIVTRATTSANR